MSGHQKIAWAETHMPILKRLSESFRQGQPLAGQRVAICLHLETKTAALALLLQAAGAQVAIARSNPLSTQDDVAAALAERGVQVFAHHGCSPEQYTAYLHRLIDQRPTLLIGDGGDLVTLLHQERSEAVAGLLGGAEETTTGVMRLKAMGPALRLPMVAVNDGQMKRLFDNRHGTGQSAWEGIMRATNLTVAGKVAVVAGYGWCGKGIAQRGRGLGARVIVTEVDPIRAQEAYMDGFEVLPMRVAAPLGDLFITATGQRDVITEEHFARMKEGALLANAGHFDVEIAVSQLPRPGITVRPGVTAHRLANGVTLYLLAEGRLVNLAGADGHPAEVMDMTFALQALALRYVVEHRPGPGLHPVPAALDRQVAELRLAALGHRPANGRATGLPRVTRNVKS